MAVAEDDSVDFFRSLARCVASLELLSNQQDLSYLENSSRRIEEYFRIFIVISVSISNTQGYDVIKNLLEQLIDVLLDILRRTTTFLSHQQQPNPRPFYPDRT